MTNSNSSSLPIEIWLNQVPVQIPSTHPTGLQIKTAAAEQGVGVQLDWVLTRITANGEDPVDDGGQITIQSGSAFSARPEPVEIEVNGRLVRMSSKEVTGLQIKEAAIQQGVSIQLDFILSVERGPRQTQIVGDEDLVHLHKHERFVAVAPDDNS